MSQVLEIIFLLDGLDRDRPFAFQLELFPSLLR